MPWTNEHLQWLQLIDTKKTADGKDIEIYELNYDLGNDEIFSKWAKHFRNHYCLDSKIERLIRGTNQTKAEYLSNIKFPESNANGAKTRAGDFGEILVSDFLEYILNFWVPRTRFSERQNRNNPTQGVDVIGFKSDDYTLNNRNDELIIFEVKCKLTGINKSYTKDRMMTAINDSKKDFSLRKAEALNGIKNWYLLRDQDDNADAIERFQDPKDKPFIELSGATSIILNQAYDEEKLIEIDASDHPNVDNLKLILIKGNDLMSLVHRLYEKAASEA